MNDCEKLAQVGAYHDGELAPATRAEMARHLAACPACAAELARLARLSDLLHAADPATDLSPALLARLHRSVDLQPRLAVLHLAEAFAAVAAVILVFAGVCLWRLAPTPATSQQIPLWEAAAVAPRDPSGVAVQEQLAQWIVKDLSGNSDHD